MKVVLGSQSMLYIQEYFYSLPSCVNTSLVVNVYTPFGENNLYFQRTDLFSPCLIVYHHSKHMLSVKSNVHCNKLEGIGLGGITGWRIDPRVGRVEVKCFKITDSITQWIMPEVLQKQNHLYFRR